MGKWIVTALAAFVVVAAGIGFLALEFLQTRPSTSSEKAIFEAAPGMSFRAIARKLEAEGLITSASKFVLYARLVGQAKSRVGEYAISKDALPKDVLQIIASGKSIERPFTVAEGLNIYDIAEIAERMKIAPRGEFLAICKNPKFIRELLGEDKESLEGYLYPETYHVTKFTTAKALVREMVGRFLEVYKQIEIAPEVHLNRSEIVTLASIVEKETGAPEERPIIASVFHNRLKLGMRLQTDPTVLYGLLDVRAALLAGQLAADSASGKTVGADAPFPQMPKNITRQDLTADNRYNTYARGGLPFGPISNPGHDALQAAAKPAASTFLYFVSQNNGTHVFSQTYEAHQKAVAAFQLNRFARESGSWRNLKGRSAESAAEHAAELSQGGKSAKKPAPKTPSPKTAY